MQCCPYVSQNPPIFHKIQACGLQTNLSGTDLQMGVSKFNSSLQCKMIDSWLNDHPLKPAWSRNTKRKVLRSFKQVSCSNIWFYVCQSYIFWGCVLDYVLLLKWFDPLCHIRGFGILISASEWKVKRPCSDWEPTEDRRICAQFNLTTLIAFIGAKVSLSSRLIKRACQWPRVDPSAQTRTAEGFIEIHKHRD